MVTRARQVDLVAAHHHRHRVTGLVAGLRRRRAIMVAARHHHGTMIVHRDARAHARARGIRGSLRETAHPLAVGGSAAVAARVGA